MIRRGIAGSLAVILGVPPAAVILAALPAAVTLAALPAAVILAAGPAAGQERTPPPGWKVSDPAAAPEPESPAYPPPPPEVQEARDLYVQGDHAAAFRKAFPFAEQGEPWAQNLVGLQYYYGHGVVQDCRFALKWLGRAAGQAHPLAMGNLARYHDAGCFGAGADDALAAEWYDKAAAAGALGYADRHARFLASGRAGPPDAARIAAVLAPALAAGVQSARVAEAELRLRGVLPADAAALDWLRGQADGGDPEARLVLARALAAGQGGLPADPAAAVELLAGLTAEGYLPAAPDEARLRIDGGGAWADPVEGWALCHWAELAAAADLWAEVTAACEPLGEALDWRIKMKAAIRGERKALR